MSQLQIDLKKHILDSTYQLGFFSLEDLKDDLSYTSLSLREQNEVIFHCVTVLNQLQDQQVITLEAGGYATLVEEIFYT